MPPIWMGEPRGHPIELVRAGKARWWLWSLVAVLVIVVAGAASVGLPGSGQLQIAVRHSGGRGVVSGNVTDQSVGDHVEIQQVGRTVRTLTVRSRLTVSLRPGLYQVIVTNVPGCGGNGLVLWGTLGHVDIVCSVK